MIADALPAAASPVTSTSAGPCETIAVVRMAPGPDVGDDVIRRLLLGDRYRDLWATPVCARVLDLRPSAGGLTPAGHGTCGAEETLILRAEDGRRYVFRPLGLDPGGAGSGSPRFPFQARLERDQATSAHPAGPLVAAAVLEAAGVLHPRARMLALPDDSTLGADRAEFGGRLGILEESTDRAVATRALLDSLASAPAERVDAREFLRARLTDFVLGDFERDPGRWRWVPDRTAEGVLWRPISPVDGWPFTKDDGLLSDFTRVRAVGVPERRGGRDDGAPRAEPPLRCDELDRILLAGLERADWDTVAARLSASLTDAVIDSAVRAMPPEMQARSARELAERLRRRRDEMPAFAARTYARLAEAVDVTTALTPEEVRVERADGRHVTVEIAERGGAGTADPPPYYRRRFDARETREIRIYLRGGGDRVRVSGPGRDPITLRVVASGRDDDLADSSAAGGVLLYDPESQVRATSVSALDVDRRPYRGAASGFGGDPRDPGPASRDYGSESAITPWANPGTRAGFFLGGQYRKEEFGFREPLYATRTFLRAGYSLALHGYVAEAGREARRPNSGLSAALFLRASSIDVSNFYGLGNATPDVADRIRRYHRVEQTHDQIRPSVTLATSPRAALTFSTPLTLVRTNLAGSGEFIREARPYGSDSYGQLGAQLGFAYGGGRSASSYLSRTAATGTRVDAIASYYPAMWGIESPFASVEGAASLGLGEVARGQPLLALRLGGKKLWGLFPFAESAFLGGGSTLIGFPDQRYAGDASAYAASELNVPLVRTTRPVPSEAGVLGLAESGRVFASGDPSSLWHSGLGAGVWVAPLGLRNRISLTFLRSDGRSGLVLRGAFGF